MKKVFYSTKEVISTQIFPFSLEQFTDFIKAYNPMYLFNRQWSTKKSFVVITEYTKEGVNMYCEGWADKTPKHFTMRELYRFLVKNSLTDFYINI